MYPKRGARKPAAVKALINNAKNTRHKKGSTPVEMIDGNEIPICPEDMPPYGKKTWGSLAPLLVRAGLLTKMDAPMFEIYCRTCSEYQALSEIPDEDMYTMPVMEIRKKTFERLMALSKAFGLTPASRRILGISFSTNEPDEFDNYLNLNR